jgi:iron complex transport system substrate-binding protein
MKLKENTIYFGLAKKSNTNNGSSGSMFQDQWYVPQRRKLFSFLKDAQANYLWKNTKGTGVSLPFERSF